MALGMQSRDSSVSPSVSGTPRRGRSVTPAAQWRKSRSRSRGRSASRRRIQGELTWADRVKKKTPKPKKVTRLASPEHDEKSEMEQLRREIASLKAELRKQTVAQAISSRVEGTNVADNAVHKSTQEPKVEVNKAKRKAPPRKDESDSEMQVESSQNKMLEELLRISKENQLSITQLALRMGALESKVGAIENKVVALENKMTIKTRPKQTTWDNKQENLGSDHFIISVTIQVRAPQAREFKVTDWDAFRKLRNEDTGEYDSFSELFQTLRADVEKATKAIQTGLNVPRMDPHLARLLEAKASILRRWKIQRLNRWLRKRVAELNREIEQYCTELARLQ
ncbi:hypothetical protein HPB51_004685 [Rhipicephalus microplus]|uniref:Uncharacterized protein n=1 Tax=Rhipicephalus microplus TaxID=6941 RepID=A0A9J6DYU9_RHIMP|nr:hypothetical protein HPB51_004685 [Rhipicephalus microplus]